MSKKSSDKAVLSPAERPRLLLPIHADIEGHRLQYGLRNDDHLRYRQYCSRRAARIRHAIKMTHGHSNKFHPKKVTVETALSSRHLELVLTLAERAWAYYMQIKDDPEDERNERRRHHWRARLKKAVYWAAELRALCAELADDTTRLEADAYHANMKALLLIDTQQWADALKEATFARTIYAQLAKIGDIDNQDMFQRFVKQLEPSLRYCRHNLGDEAPQDADVEVAQSLQETLASVVEEARKQQSATLSEIQWGQRRVPVRSDAVREAIVKARRLTDEMERQRDADVEMEARVEAYETVLNAYTDAIDAARKALTSLPPPSARSVKEAGSEEHLNATIAYLSAERIKLAVQRLLVMVDTLDERLEAERAGSDGKRTKEADLMRLFDSLASQVADMKALCDESDADDQETLKKCSADALLYEAHRTFYGARHYVKRQQHLEAYTLLRSGADLAKKALDHYGLCKEAPADGVRRAKALRDRIDGLLVEARARAFMASHSGDAGADADVATGTASLGDSGDLLDNIDRFEHSCVRRKALQSVPPAMEHVAAKPTLFDLSLNQLRFPDLSKRVAAKKGFWGLW